MADHVADDEARWNRDAANIAEAIDALLNEAVARGLDHHAAIAGAHACLVCRYIRFAGWQFVVERLRATAAEIELLYGEPEGRA